ncbi:MAG: hypothetical protein AAFQ64_11515 [Pseudomonadota bacterium]
MIRLAGIAGVGMLATAASATTPACPPAGLRLDVQEFTQTITIVNDCLGDAEDVGIALAEIARQILEAHQSQFPDQSYVAVEEVLVESFVSEILAPSVPAN